MSDWQPIETAPFGVKILLWYPHNDSVSTIIFQEGYKRLTDATHWMPLPKPPEL